MVRLDNQILTLPLLRFESPAKEETMPLISFPGGGIFFYWQAGAVMYLDSHFNMTR